MKSSLAMDSSVKYGLGVTAPNEMARRFELMAQGKAVSVTADSAVLSMLARNTDVELTQRLRCGDRAGLAAGMGV